MYVPTKSEEGKRLFDDDLRTGIVDGGRINCRPVGFLANVILTCRVIHGKYLLSRPV